MCSTGKTLKLHLGCGQRYLQGYVNIDFPLSSHSVQESSVADVHADILSLRFDARTIAEIRLHHVFEHFSRPVACALLSSWDSWLAPEGRLHIEVPDFRATSIRALNPFFTRKSRMVAMRHIFGSHEAPWAAHQEGYSQKDLKLLLGTYGFDVVSIKKNSWKGTFNFEMIALKSDGSPKSREHFSTATRRYLTSLLLDDSDSEQRLLEVWMQIYTRHVNKTWAMEK